MKLSFKKFDPESERLVLAKLLSSQSWPFHVHSSLTKEKVLQSVLEGNFSDDSNQTFWIVLDDTEKVGIIRLFEMDDLDDGSPLFDIRILNKFQGRGIGKQGVKWLTHYLFERWSKLNRIEGTTRVDNIPMRKVFEQTGFAKEGHYRKSWPDKDGNLQDTVRYSILRNDWQSGTITQVNWSN